MAEKNTEAERAARERKEQELQAALDQEAADKAKGPAPAAVPASQPATEAKAGPRLVLKSDVVRRAPERFESFSVRIDGLTSSGDALKADIEAMLNDSSLLWPVHNRIPRFSEVILHSEYFTWEVRVRVMSINADLHTVVLSQIGPIVLNRTAAKAIDWASIQISHRGAKARWSVLHKGDVLKDNFETEESAKNWLAMQKFAA